MEASTSKVQAFFAGFGFSSGVAASLAEPFGGDLQKARDAVSGWLSTVAPWVNASTAGLAAARAAFVRAGLARVSAEAFSAMTRGESVTVPAPIVSALENRVTPLPAVLVGSMQPQDVRMLPVVDDVLRSVLPLAPRRSS